MTKERLTLSIDKDLKRRFSLVCKWKEFEMSQIAAQLFDEWLEKNTPPGLFDLEPKEKSK